MAGSDGFLDEMSTDKTGGSGDKNPHDLGSPSMSDAMILVRKIRIHVASLNKLRLRRHRQPPPWFVGSRLLPPSPEQPAAAGRSHLADSGFDFMNKRFVSPQCNA